MSASHKTLALEVGELVTVRSVYEWALVVANLGSKVRVVSIYRIDNFGSRPRKVREQECRRAYPTFAGPYLPARRHR